MLAGKRYILQALFLLELISSLAVPLILLSIEAFVHAIPVLRLMPRSCRHLRLVLHNFLDRGSLRHTPMPVLPIRCEKSLVSTIIIRSDGKA